MLLLGGNCMPVKTLPFMNHIRLSKGRRVQNLYISLLRDRIGIFKDNTFLMLSAPKYIIKGSIHFNEWRTKGVQHIAKHIEKLSVVTASF